VGTLIHPSPPVDAAYHTAGQKFGSRLKRQEVADRFRSAFPKVCSDQGEQTSALQERERWRRVVGIVFDDVDPQSAEPLFDHLWDHFAQSQHWQVSDGAEAVWQSFIDRGWKVGIASNFDSRLCQIAAELSPLDRAEWLFYSEALQWSKPAAQFYDKIQTTLGVPCESLLMIGDSWENDYEAPRRAGWQAICTDNLASIANGL